MSKVYNVVSSILGGGAGLQRDNNLAGKIQREWTLLSKTKIKIIALH
jgi:hypothetical protein